MKEMTHDQLQEMLAAYVFGGLEAEETAQVAAHLDTDCAECIKELRSLSSTVEQYARTAPASRAPRHLKDQILKQIKAEGIANSGRSSSRRSLIPWGVAIAAVIVVIALGLQVMQMRRENVALKNKLHETEDVTALLSAPGMQFVNLAGVAPNEQAFGKVVLDPERGAAVVYMYRLPQQPEGKEYQLWIMRDGKPTSAGLFRVGEDGNAHLALQELPEGHTLSQFWVTIEPVGGQLLPTGMMYLTTPQTP